MLLSYQPLCCSGQLVVHFDSLAPIFFPALGILCEVGFSPEANLEGWDADLMVGSID